MQEENRIIVPAGEVFRKLLILNQKDAARSDFLLKIASGAQVEITLLIMPGVSSDVNFSIDMDDAKASCQLRGIYLCPADEKVNIRVEMRHNVPQCLSTQMFKGIVSGTAKVDFYGRIIVAPDAQQTEAYQENHSLLLSDTAKVFTKPQLEIYADDVKCSHGATIGKLSEDEQFYMRSRGISETDAKALQMQSFLSPVLDTLHDEAEKEKLQELLATAIQSSFC